MFKFFWERPREPRSNDPFDHPPTRAMSLDQIGALPMTPVWPHGSRRVSAMQPERCRVGYG